MKRTIFGVLGSVAFAGALVAAQANPVPQNPPDQAQKSEVTVTGCVIQGTSPTVFLLDNARVRPDDPNEKGKTYLLISADDLKPHLNHEVSASGNAEAKTPPVPPAGQKVNEKDLPKFTAKAVTMVADRCTPAGH
jgi:hypothetical protein